MKLVISAVLSATLACPLASAQSGTQCPDTIATNVPATVKSVGPYTRCGVGIEIFGLPLTIGGAKCFRYQFVYPAHQECLGAVNPGTACLPEGSMPVLVELCECSTLGVIHTGISIPKCSCDPGGTAGTVDDAQTLLCPGQE
jgi:hypothetical protein